MFIIPNIELVKDEQVRNVLFACQEKINQADVPKPNLLYIKDRETRRILEPCVLFLFDGIKTGLPATNNIYDLHLKKSLDILLLKVMEEIGYD